MLKSILMSFHIIFLNSDFPLDDAPISSNVLYSLLEGSKSRSFDIGPGYFFKL